MLILKGYMACCGVAGAAVGVNMAAHGHFGGSSSTGKLVFGVIGGAVFGSTFGAAYVVPLLAYNKIHQLFYFNVK